MTSISLKFIFSIQLTKTHTLVTPGFKIQLKVHRNVNRCLNVKNYSLLYFDQERENSFMMLTSETGFDNWPGLSWKQLGRDLARASNKPSRSLKLYYGALIVS